MSERFKEAVSKTVVRLSVPRVRISPSPSIEKTLVAHPREGRLSEIVAVIKNMNKQAISGGVAHTIPEDLEKALTGNKVALEKWESLTPLARNEWICWTITVKQEKTRKEHVERAVCELKEGKRRPCCWPGCPHREDKPLNPTQKWIFSDKK